MGNGEDPIIKLYNAVKASGYYTKSLNEFRTQYATPESIDKMFDVVSGDGLYTKTKEDFYNQYFPTVKKKELVGGILSFAGGQVGNGKAPLKEENISAVEDPAKYLLQPYRERKVQAEKEYQKNLPIGGYNLMAIPKADTKQEYDVATKDLSNMEEQVFNKLFPDTRHAISYIQQKYDQAGDKVPEDNETFKIALQKVNQRRGLDDIVASSSSIEDAAAKYYGENFNDLPDIKKGKYLRSFLNRPEVKEKADEGGQFLHDYNVAKGTLISKYPQDALQKIATDISQELEDKKMTNWFYSNPSVDKTDKAVQQLVDEGKMSLEEKNVYDKALRPIIEAGGADVVLKTSDLIHGLGRGLYHGMENIDATLRDVVNRVTFGTAQKTGLIETNEERRKRLENERLSQTELQPKGARKFVTEASEFAGFSIPMIFGSMAKVPQAMNMALMFEGANADKARDLFKDDAGKQDLYTLLSTGADMYIMKLLPTKKFAEGAKNLFASDIKELINELGSGKISQEQASKTFLEKLTNYAKKVGVTNFETANALTAFQLAHNTIDAAFGKRDFNLENEVKEALTNYKTNFLSGTFLSMVGAAPKSNEINTNGKILRELANRSEQVLPEIKNDAEKIKNLQTAIQINKEIEGKDWNEDYKNKFMANAMKESVLKEKQKSAPTEALKKQSEEELDRAKKTQEAILAGKNPDEVKTDNEIELERLQKDKELSDKDFEAKRKQLDGRIPEDRPKIEKLEEDKKRAEEDYQREVEKLSPKVKPEETFPEGENIPSEEKIPEQKPQAISSGEQVGENANKYYSFDFNNKRYEEEPNAKPVKLAKEGDYFSVKRDYGNYEIHDTRTGARVGFGKGLKNAIADANDRIDRFKDLISVEDAQKKHIETYGENPRYETPKTEIPQTEEIKNISEVEKPNKVQQSPEVKELTVTDVNKEVGEAKKGTGEPPPEKPTEPVVEEKVEEPLKNKALANRLVESKNIPAEAKKGIEEKGLKYEPQSHEEAATIAKEVIEQEGIDNAVLQAQAGKFGGDVNTLIQTTALDRLAELSDKEPEGAKKFEYDKKFAEIATNLDEWLRTQAGRGISALNYFYKKSPLGIVMMENAKRGEDFKQWSKPKEKSWREFYDELMKEPEFEKLVKEEVKKERAEERKTRTEKVHQAIDETLTKWAKKLSIKNKGDIQKQGIGDIDKVMKAVGVAMKKAYDAGEAIKKIVQDAIDYISEQLGTAEWNSEDFRSEWEKKLQDKKVRKSPTDEELRTRILERYRKKLRGLPDKQKDEVIRRSFKELIENGALEFDDFKKIIGEVTGRGELTPEQVSRMKELVKITNEVETTGKKVQEERTKEALIQFHTAQLKAGKATRELNELFNNKPDIIKRLTSIMQLNTLGIPALINNPIYNVFNQMVVRLPVGLVNDIVDRTMAAGAKLLGKPYEREWNILETQKDFFKGLGLGTKEAGEQFLTGLNRQDYIQKEVYGQQIRPFRAWRDLIKNFRGNMPMSTRQWWDKALQGTFGIPAEVVARTLNLGDKPQRFAAEKAQASAFSKILGLKNIDKAIFMEFPREEAYRAYKAKGLSDVEAGKKADYIKESIIKEGQRSTFQQDNLLNDVLTRAFGVFGGKESGTATLLKSLTISPYIKIPSNAFWSFYNLVNPEVALLQSMIHGARALSLKGKEGIGSEKALREARYWMGHAITGIAIRAVVVQMVNNGIFTPSQEDETKKEREGRAFFEPQGTVNVTKLAAFLRGERPQDVEGGVTVSSRWFGILGMTGNTIARKYEDMTPEQREKQQEFWNVALGGMEVEALRELQNGVFSNTSAIINSLGSGSLGAKQYGLNVMNMVMNIAHPAVLAQISRAQLPYYTTTKAESFLKSAENSMLARSSVLRSLTGKYPEPKLNIWGEPMLRQGSVIEKLFGINHINKDNFAQPIYEDVKQTGDIGFFPPSVPDRLGDKKLNNEQQKRLTELVGQARKNLVAPYINDMAEIEGFGLKYSELKDLDIKKKVLQYLYDLGKEEGVRNFVNDYPEFQKEGLDLANEINNARLEVFREINKVKTLK